MKEKFLWGMIFVTILSWSLNYVYFQSKQLKQPIFLEHYYQTFLHNDTQLTFYYLTNKQNPTEVVNVTIDGIEGVYVTHQEEGFFIDNDPSPTSYKQEFRHHYLKSVTIEFRNGTLPKGKLNIQKMEMMFNNHAPLTVDIGTVTFLGEVPNDGPIEFVRSSASNNHRSDIAFVIKEPVTINRITPPFKEINADIAVKLDLDQKKLKDLETLIRGGNNPKWYEESQNGKWADVPGVSIKEDIFPIQLETNEGILLNMYFNPNRFTYFDFGLRIEGVTAKGEPFVQMAPVNDQPTFNQKQIDLIIAEKEGGK